MENKKMIKESFDWHYFRTQVIVSVSLVLGMLLLAVVLSAATQQTVTLWAGIIAYLLIFLPWLGYYLYRMWEIIRAPERYVLYEAVAKKAYPALGRKIYFEVEITHEDGSTETVETKAVFSLSILTDRYWGEIKGQKILILYDKTDYAERVVAVRRLED